MLDKQTLQTDIASALDAAKTAGKSGDFNAWRDTFASQLADAVDSFVKSGQVNTTVTIPVTSSPGTPSSGTGTGAVT